MCGRSSLSLSAPPPGLWSASAASVSVVVAPGAAAAAPGSPVLARAVPPLSCRRGRTGQGCGPTGQKAQAGSSPATARDAQVASFSHRDAEHVRAGPRCAAGIRVQGGARPRGGRAAGAQSGRGPRGRWPGSGPSLTGGHAGVPPVSILRDSPGSCCLLASCEIFVSLASFKLVWNK